MLPSVRTSIRLWIFSLLGWGLFIGIVASQFVLTPPYSWVIALHIAARDWAPFIVITPLVVLLTKHIPVERLRWLRAATAHVAACAAAMSFCSWSGVFFAPRGPRGERPFGPEREMRGPPPDRPERPFPGGLPDGIGDRRFDRGGPPPEGLPPDGRGELGRPPRGGELFPHLDPHSFGGPPRRLLLNFPIYWVLVSFAHALVFYRRAQERERSALELTGSLAQARLAALRMQLQPHFLFNALNAVAALVHTNPEAADEMLGALSDFLRLTLESADEQETPLAREMEFVERYLAIEQVRFGDRLTVEKDLAPETLRALVPVLVLQPLVENAVRHGIEPQMEPGRIRITSRRDGESLRIGVMDSGAGFREGAPQREGVGLSNTRARLQELHGDAARLEISSTDGVEVQIIVPFREAPVA